MLSKALNTSKELSMMKAALNMKEFPVVATTATRTLGCEE